MLFWYERIIEIKHPWPVFAVLILSTLISKTENDVVILFTVRRRKGKTEDTHAKSDTQSTENIELKEKEAKKESDGGGGDTKEEASLVDPLHWFGILVPSALRQGQTNFVQGEDFLCEKLFGFYILIRYWLRFVQNQVGRDVDAILLSCVHAHVFTLPYVTLDLLADLIERQAQQNARWHHCLLGIVQTVVKCTIV